MAGPLVLCTNKYAIALTFLLPTLFASSPDPPFLLQGTIVNHPVNNSKTTTRFPFLVPVMIWMSCCREVNDKEKTSWLLFSFFFLSVCCLLFPPCLLLLPQTQRDVVDVFLFLFAQNAPFLSFLSF
ncbi:MAG: hypothetical protein JOS17DRAFT_41663 [Linnemannia elongata]|nr:MAG: hypothetical protein JOS17DRAFT_41663 [Linnemannia elongata]